MVLAEVPVSEYAMPRKEDTPCCAEKVDALGRLPIGFCGPDCFRRTIRDLIREHTARSQRRWSTPWNPVYLDAYDGWEPNSDPWDDPTADAALRLVDR